MDRLSLAVWRGLAHNPKEEVGVVTALRPRIIKNPHEADDDSRGRHFTVTAEAGVSWEGEDRGTATWFFHRNDPLVEDLDTLWEQAGIWQDEFGWNPASPLGEKFFRLCRAELLTLAEANRVVALLKGNVPHWGTPAIRRMGTGEISGELPVRMVSSPRGTVVHWDLCDSLFVLDFPVAGLAEPAHPSCGRPIGWYGWPCRKNDMS
jgi:hypothetical protein